MEPINLTSSSSSPSINEQPKISKELEGLGSIKKETIHRSNNFFSSKGLVVNAYRGCPFQLLKSAYVGIKVAYKEGVVKGITKFFSKMGERYDIYEPLKKLIPGDERSTKIVDDNIRYAELMKGINTNNEEIDGLAKDREMSLKNTQKIETLEKEGAFDFLGDDMENIDLGFILKDRNVTETEPLAPSEPKREETIVKESDIESPSDKTEVSPFGSIEPSSSEEPTENLITPSKKKEEGNIIGKVVSAKSFEIHNAFLEQLQKIATNPEIKSSEPGDKKVLSEIVSKLLDSGFKQKDGYFYDLKTGNIFTIAYEENKNELVLCFGGMGSHTQILDDLDEIAAMSREQVSQMKKEYMGNVPVSAQQAIGLGQLLKQVAEENGAKPVVVGHSHGGGLAQAAAAAADIKGVVFNSRPIGRGVRKYIQENYIEEGKKEANPKSSKELRKEFIKSTDDNITAFAGKGDFVTKGMRTLTFVVNGLLGISVPRNLGTGYYIDVQHTPENPEI